MTAAGRGMAEAGLAVPRPARLPGYVLFAAMLAAAGLPIYIHAPKFYVDAHGVSLAALGGVLFALRLADVVQDPLLGWLAQATARWRGAAVMAATTVLALAMLGLFAVPPPVSPLLWFALMLTALFSAFSFLTICFYAQGVTRASAEGAGGHVRIAGWRETGALVGVCVAAAAPTVLVGLVDDAFAGFALGFAALCLVAVVVMRGEWSTQPDASGRAGAGFATVLSDPLARRLLLLALLNAMPVAVTSTLFLFYVESRLQAPGWEGPLLILFFLSAAASAPLWSLAARRFGTRRMLLAGMALAVVTFAFAIPLGAGDIGPFVAVCIASGAALGADLTLLAALFARRMEQILPGAAEGFGLWAFASKLSLALAAATVLPLLDSRGFVAGPENSPDALMLLALLYAGVPCFLKLLAIALLAVTPMKES